MKAFVIKSPFDAELCDLEKPTISDNEVLLRVDAAGFCGTDIHTYKGEHVTDYPIVPGHEFSGTIVETGSRITKFKVGDFVLADPNIFCENCDACKRNKQIHCKNIQVIGNTRNGAFAEYVAVPEQCVFFADGIDPLQAAMAEPLACVINAHNKIIIPIGANVLIAGAGTIGLMHLLITKRRGAASVTMIDLKESQLQLSKSIGAESVFVSTPDIAQTLKAQTPAGFDVIIDATGVPRVIEAFIPLLAETGTFLFFGACATDSIIKVNPFEVYYKDVKLIGSYALQKTMQQSLDMLRGGLDLSPLIGRIISIDEMPQVFNEFVNGQTSNKILVAFNSQK